MTAFRSILGKLVGYSWTALLGFFTWPIVFFGKDATMIVGDFWARGCLAIGRVVAGVKWEVTGLEHLPEGPFVLASKHQSFFDTVIWSQLLESPAYVMKEELLKQPIFGWYIRHLDIVALDRSAGMSSLRKLLADSGAMAAKGKPIIIFPEGTRTPPGERGRYHPGVAAIYDRLSIPVVPVGTDSGVFWDRGWYGFKPGKIRVSIQPPIQPGLEKRAFLNQMADSIEQASMDLLPDQPQLASDEGSSTASS